MKPDERVWWVDPESMDDEVGIYDTFDKHPGQGPLQWQASLIKVVPASELERVKGLLDKAMEIINNTRDAWCIKPECACWLCDGIKELEKIRGG